MTWLKQCSSRVPPEDPAVLTIESGIELTISPTSKTTSTTESKALSNIWAIELRFGLSKLTLSTPVGETRKLPSIIITSGTCSTSICKDEASASIPPRLKVDLYASRSIFSVPAIAIRVLGASTGFIGKVGSSTLPVLSPEKFLMPIIHDSLDGTSPGKFAEPGASPSIVKYDAISSGGIDPAGKP